MANQHFQPESLEDWYLLRASLVYRVTLLKRGAGGMVVQIVTLFSFEQLYIYQWIYIHVYQFWNTILALFFPSFTAIISYSLKTKQIGK